MTAVRALAVVLAMSVRVSPWQSIVCLAEALGKALMACTPLFLGWLVDGAIRHDSTTMTRAVVALVGASGCNMALQMLGTNARITQIERVGFAFDTDVCRYIANIPTLAHLEDPGYLDRAQVLRDNQQVLGQALNQVLNTINNVTFVVTTIAVAAAADWRLLILLVAGVPRIVITRWFVRWERDAEARSGPHSRLAERLLTLTTTVGAGAEIRVFGLADPLRRRLRSSVSAKRQPYVELATRSAAVETANTVLFYGVTIAVLGWIVGDVLAGTVPVAALVVALAVASKLQSIALFISGMFQGFSRTLRNVERYAWLRDYAADAASADGSLQPSHDLADGIRLEHVHFRYPGADRDSLADVSLHIPAGTVIALVGENGAGKSTLVNLLTGMHRPTGGVIRINGYDSTELESSAWRRLTSGAFQDFVSFELTAHHTVSLGDTTHLDDANRVRTAISAAAADDIVTGLPTGLATQLGTTWPNGINISRGQWQRLAIARGFMRRQPQLLILDEPTSALDAATEHEVFERYTAAARAGQTQGTITVLVTHRFSTAASADLVLVLDNGSVIETGTHDQLLERHGHYAELYALQATGYR